MNPHQRWPSQGHPNGHYQHPPQPNIYPPPVAPQPSRSQIPMHPEYSIPRPVQTTPRVGVAPGHPHPSPHDAPQTVYRSSHPHVVIPGRSSTQSFVGHAHNSKIRQVQVPAQNATQALQHINGLVERQTAQSHSKSLLAQARPPSVKQQRSQSYQDSIPRPHQRNGPSPPRDQKHHRTPLLHQMTATQRTSSTHSGSSQHRGSLPQAPSSQTRSHPQVVIQKAAPSAVLDPSHQSTTSNGLPVDLSVLLLAAADEYVTAARSLGSVTAMRQRETDVRHYYELIAAGLGCMEAVLTKYNQTPRDEARLRLRYASLLVEETENNVEIEDVLTKGITLCSRCRFHDLKYSMQHLYARYQSKTNPRAAMKTLDGHISETETFQHISWVYAFRFLRVSLSLKIPNRPETASALQQLHAIANHASRRGDRAVFVTCHAVEALIHLRTPGTDNLEHAQRAIAQARSLQLQISAQELGPIAALIDCIDVACSLQQGKPDQNKMVSLQKNADSPLTRDDGTFSVLVEKSSGGNMTSNTGGIFSKTEDGCDKLNLSWLSQKDFNVLAYLFSGVTSLAYDNKGPYYIKEGLKITQAGLNRPSYLSTSIPASIHQTSWLLGLEWHLKFTLGLVACRTEDMLYTQQALESLRHRLGQSPFNDANPYLIMMHYLSGVYDQCKGSFESALSTYSLPALAIPGSNLLQVEFYSDLAVLATMNRLLILRNPAHPDHHLSGVLFSQLEPVCANHRNQYINCAFRLIRAMTVLPDTSINRQKTLIQNAISSSDRLRQSYRNFQFITMGLHFMASRFFADGYDESAIKSVRAARSMAKQNQAALWKTVALGLCMHTYHRNRLEPEVADCQDEFRQLRGKLPEQLRELTVGYAGMDNAVK